MYQKNLIPYQFHLMKTFSENLIDQYPHLYRVKNVSKVHSKIVLMVEYWNLKKFYML